MRVILKGIFVATSCQRWNQEFKNNTKYWRGVRNKVSSNYTHRVLCFRNYWGTSYI